MLSALALVSLLATLAQAPDLSALEAELGRIVKKSRGDIGVAVIHIESGATIAIHGDDRFPMASVYKLPIAVEFLNQVAEGKLSLDQPVRLAPSDIRVCCTLSRRYPKGDVTLPAADLLELMMVESDNTAGDAILKLVGGPAVVQQRLRERGFEAINVNRYEGDIAFERGGVPNPPPRSQWTYALQRQLLWSVSNGALDAAHERYTLDPRDTATPGDMARFLGRLHVGDLLPRYYTDMLLMLMRSATTGPRRIRALLPPDTPVAHKTGTTDVVVNDVGIVSLPEDAQIPGHVALVVFVMNGGRATRMQDVIARLSGATFEFFTGRPLPKPAKPRPAKKRQPRKT